MANKNQRKGNSYKNQYKAYNGQSKEHKNRIKKLQRVVRNQPNNLQAAEALNKTLKGEHTHKAGRRSGGHVCKGLYKELGFKENKPQEIHKKKALHWYMGGSFNFKQNKDTKANLAMHGDSVAYQLRQLGIK
jgi:hypothetical protein